MKILFKPPAQTLADPSVIARDLEYILFSRLMPLKVATSKSISFNMILIYSTEYEAQYYLF